MKRRNLLCLLLVLAMMTTLFGGCSSTSATTETAPAETTAEPAAQQAPEPAPEAAPAEPAPEPAAEEPAPAEAPASAEEPVPEAPPAAEPEAAPEGPGPEPGEPAPEPEAEPAVDTAEPDLPRNSIPLPLADGETLSYWLPWIPMLDSYYSEYNDHPAYQHVEERTGVHMDFISPSQQASTMEFSLMIASGDYPDLISSINNYSNGLDAAVEEEVFINMAPYLADYAPDYYYFLKTNDVWMKYVTTDLGNIVGFYGFDRYNLGDNSGPMIRQDWLDDLGLDAPSSINDWHDTLLAFKDAYNCSDPFMMGTGCTALSASFGTVAFDLSGGNGGCFYLKDGKVTCAFVEEEYRDYITAMHQWYEEGLFAREFYARTSSTAQDEMTSIILNGQCGIFDTVMKNLEDYERQSAVEGFALTAIPWPTLADGSKLQTKKIDPSAGSTSAISTNCDNVELAMKWSNFWFTDEGLTVANYGVEGLSYTLDEEGNPVYTDVIDHNPDGLIYQIARIMYCVNQVPSLGDPTIIRDHIYSQRVIDASAIWTDAYAGSDMVLSSSAALSVDEADEYASIYTDIATYATETLLRFVLGEASLDGWDEFVDTVKDSGIDTCIELYQSAYERYLSR